MSESYFMDVAAPILSHPEFLRTKSIRHHDGCVFDHVLAVARMSYRIAGRLGMDKKAIIRGALLHDFHLYRFCENRKWMLPFDVLRHARVHPKDALSNAMQHFSLSDREKDIIRSHMFPFQWPRFRESWVVSMADKILAVQEYWARFSREKAGFRKNCPVGE